MRRFFSLSTPRLDEVYFGLEDDAPQCIAVDSLTIPSAGSGAPKLLHRLHIMAHYEQIVGQWTCAQGRYRRKHTSALRFGTKIDRRPWTMNTLS